MQQIIPHIILGNTFLLSTNRCIFWQDQKILIISDLHLGKTGHFRKSGIAVPQALYKEDMQRLVTQLQLFKPAQVIVIGDMFHSHDNKEHGLFLKWRKDFEQLSIVLVKGNHDILKEDWYVQAGIQLCNPQQGQESAVLRINNFFFTHDMNDTILNKSNTEHYYFSGHVHPGISIRGLGKQSLRFPCFYFSKQFAVLPAFSRFTGTIGIKPKPGESVYALLPANHLNGELGGIIKV